ncbi:hypothetical protein K431DRAFT_53464 [Polychaeton citri CBS 116435]|uniref:Diaminohydroxyphosphoribosylamino-pyrimidine deaminase n=1 Tax=Polychaeton citri CBS 116435 TaxID=1314669 RepID=A0A9P4QEK1_9PEZI|nr:hypothetical protein K431DRAFT_53464 [Polychaeton citri CBS 116435]
MIDSSTDQLEISIGGLDFFIKQSPTVLNSTRAGGTTGAALWQSSVRVAVWITQAQNPLFTQGLLDQTSIVMELGCGIAGVLPLVLSPRVRQYIATDQQYTLKLLNENLKSNESLSSPRSQHGLRKQPSGKISTFPFDWETDDARNLTTHQGANTGVDLVICCDCVYNFALIAPLVQAMRDICRIRQSSPVEEGTSMLPTVCMVAQQLRQSDVHEEWLRAFAQDFQILRIKDELLSEELKEGSGYAVYLGILH